MRSRGNGVPKMICRSQTPYLILTEYMNKGDLKHLLQSERRSTQLWPVKLKLDCALQVAQGLEYLTVVKS